MEEGEVDLLRPEMIESNQSSSNVYYEDEEEDYHGPRSVFPVAPLDASFDPTKEPATGEEYLRLVRLQDMTLPKALSAPDRPNPQDYAADYSLFDEIALMLRETPEETHPSDVWINEYISQFSTLFSEENDDDQQSNLQEWPKFGDELAWFEFMYPQIEPRTKKKRLEDGEAEEGSVPFRPDDLSHNRPSQRQLMQLFKLHTKWLNNQDLTINEQTYQYLFRMLQILDPRLSANQVANLRSLALAILRLRKDLPADDSTSIFYSNGIICILARIFGQHDLLLLNTK